MTEHDLERSLGRIEGNVEAMKESISAIFQKIDNLPCADHQTELRELQIKAGFWGGFTGMITALGTTIIGWFAFRR
jgi:hypothetical protein